MPVGRGKVHAALFAVLGVSAGETLQHQEPIISLIKRTRGGWVGDGIEV
jgi:hypothetical protein